MTDLSNRYQAVKQRIIDAANQHDRAVAPRLVAVSKRHSADAIREVNALGQVDFGESYVQEALVKIDALKSLAISWHFIGPIQSNKCQSIAQAFDWVHSADRAKVLNKLSRYASDREQPLNVLLQLKVGGEASKSGVDEAELMSLASTCLDLPGLRLRGLMSIPPPAAGLATQLGFCREAFGVFQKLKALGDDIDTLSLGMSGDLEAAIQSGSTMLRIGTDVFGPRD